MNATGDSDEANYHAMIAGEQERILRPALNRLDPVIMGHAMVASEDAWFDFAPLKVMSEKDKADVALVRANTVTAYVNNGTIPIDALGKVVPNMVAEDGTFPGLEQALEDLPDTAFDPPGPEDKNEPAAADMPEGKDLPETNPREGTA